MVTSDLAELRQTDRLVLQPWSSEALDDFASVCSNADAMRFITRGRPIPRRAVEKISNRSLALWQEYGYGPWAAFERNSGRWVGRSGLNLLHDWPRPDKWEVGFEIAPEFWGRGFATEGAREAVRFGFEDAGLTRIISVTVPDHHASRRVMEKAGLTYQGPLDWRGTQVVWYAIDRAPHPTGLP